MGKNYAIDTGSGIDYLPGAPWNKTPAEAEEVWRHARKLFFMPVTVRPTTDDEDARLGSAADVLNKLGERAESH